MIREVGLSAAKARALRILAVRIESEFKGRVPSTEDALLSLPGVGPKTADAVIVFGYQQSGLPIDTHIHRVVNRLGVVQTQTAPQTALELRRALPRRFWNLINPVFVQHGMNVCTARAPKCPLCPIESWCLKAGVKTRGHPMIKMEEGAWRRSDSHPTHEPS